MSHAIVDAPAETVFSPRELQILELLVQGAGYAAIARRLQLSRHTVDTYMRRIRAKTGATNQVQLAVLACQVHGVSAAAPSR
ncbi:helix-turn-helix transcriptional regulator [Streptomyces sp. NBC_00820]|uniref:response regulator transcription factor n=1 Tax=Streptomyces sp. NBC_00820 TaxID=2975842 RepID=UPI002ED33B6B|nr:helix-turn-helix transcriptional regulator [Streptomyces sp. NBC_00820]